MGIVYTCAAVCVGIAVLLTGFLLARVIKRRSLGLVGDGFHCLMAPPDEPGATVHLFGCVSDEIERTLGFYGSASVSFRLRSVDGQGGYLLRRVGHLRVRPGMHLFRVDVVASVSKPGTWDTSSWEGGTWTPGTAYGRQQVRLAWRNVETSADLREGVAYRFMPRFLAGPDSVEVEVLGAPAYRRARGPLSPEELLQIMSEELKGPDIRFRLGSPLRRYEQSYSVAIAVVPLEGKKLALAKRREAEAQERAPKLRKAQVRLPKARDDEGRVRRGKARARSRARDAAAAKPAPKAVDEQIRAAAEAIVQIGGESALRSAAEGLNSPSGRHPKRVRRAAAQALVLLARRGDSRAREVLRDAINSECIAARRAAREALRSLAQTDEREP